MNKPKAHGDIKATFKTKINAKAQDELSFVITPSPVPCAGRIYPSHEIPGNYAIEWCEGVENRINHQATSMERAKRAVKNQLTKRIFDKWQSLPEQESMF